MHLRHDLAGAPHQRDLVRGLAGDHSWPRPRRGLDRLDQRLEHFVAAAVAVDVHEPTRAGGSTGSRAASGPRRARAAHHRVFGVVVALHHVAAAHVAEPRILRRLVDVIRVPHCTHTRRPAMRREHDLGGHVEVGHDVEGRLVERASSSSPAPACAGTRRARSRPRRATVLRPRCSRTTPITMLVGDQLAAVDVAAAPRRPSGGALARRGAEDVAGGEVRDVVVLAPPARPGCPSRPLLAEQDDPACPAGHDGIAQARKPS